MGRFPCSPAALAPLRASLLSTPSSTTHSAVVAAAAGQVRHATFIARPRRPYQFTQLVQLSDGSTYLARTTSPQALYKTNKDSRNTLTWQPSEKSLRNVELDEAGKLAAFRERFGRGFDAANQDAEGAESGEGGADAAAAAPSQDGGLDDAGLADLISGYAPQDSSAMKDSGPKKSPTRRK